MTVSTHTRTLGITGAEATGTITITAFANLDSTDKVNLIATDGTNYDFVNGDQSSVNGTWESTTSNDATATNLMNVINTSSGPAGTRVSATVDGAVVTVTQNSGSEASLEDGNTAITVTDAGGVGMTADSAFTGGSSSAVVNDRGVVMQGGNIAGSRLSNKSILDTVKGADEYGSKLGVVTGTAHEVGLAVARSVGTPKFAFFPKPTDRTAANSTFLARGLQTKVAGAASTEDIMGVLGSNHSVRSIHLHTHDHYQRGSWATLAFNLFKNPTAGQNDNSGLVQSDMSAKIGATNYGIAANFRNIADQDNALPITNRPSRAIPGELVFLVDFVDRSTSGGNFKDYSAITGD